MKSNEKLIEMVESFDNGNISWFWAEVGKLSTQDRARLIGLARAYGQGGTVWAFEIATRCITKDFGRRANTTR